VSASALIEFIAQEEASSNYNGMICLADLIIEYYPDSDENAAAVEKKNAANAAIEAEIAAKKAVEANQELKQSHEDLKNELSNLESSFSNYDTIVEKLN
jgi:UDP-N-acetylglucosamine:LPS N-acetylglucosamine transferase